MFTTVTASLTRPKHALIGVFCLALLSGCAHVADNKSAPSAPPKHYSLNVPGMQLDLPTAVAQPKKQVSCTPLAADRQEAAVADINYAFSLIPATAWKKINLQTLTLCDEVRNGADTVGGFAMPGRHHLFLTAGAGKTTHQSHLALHELYRYLEQRDNSVTDRAWNKRFSGYTLRYDGNTQYTYIGSAGDGFLNKYAKTFPQEERAELFASMVLEPLALQIFVKQHNDKKLLDKVVYMNKKASRLLGYTVLKHGN